MDVDGEAPSLLRFPGDGDFSGSSALVRSESVSRDAQTTCGGRLELEALLPLKNLMSLKFNFCAGKGRKE
jgi:hypothetical protein